MKQLFPFFNLWVLWPCDAEKRCTLTPNRAQPYDPLHLRTPHLKPASLLDRVSLALPMLQRLSGFKRARAASSRLRYQTHTPLNGESHSARRIIPGREQSASMWFKSSPEEWSRWTFMTGAFVNASMCMQLNPLQPEQHGLECANS